MKKAPAVAGVGAIAFGVLLFVGMVLASPPGGSYSASDVADYVAKGHRTSVIVSIYLVVLAAVGLVCLLARLRDAIADARTAAIFWAIGTAAVAGFVIGYALVAAVPLAIAYGGSAVTLQPTVVFTLAEAGWVVMYGAGGVLLGCALVALALRPAGLPAWVRWSTLVAGICGLAAPLWFPFFVVLIWAVVIGVWLLAADRGRVEVPQTQAA